MAKRYGTGPAAARALSRSVSDVDRSRIMRRLAFLGVSAPRAVVGRREFLAHPAPYGPGSQWRDRAGLAPGFLPCRRHGVGGPDDPPRIIVRVRGKGQGVHLV
ncbi:hypothetical protein GCM10010384_35020 [Streptomyces djakartensis]|uniref:Transposase n=1 Tax=Streptomyces djakartensis TaxID=68193 RepID=A0ABQ2ZTI4_9ACTN|nr:hypothetical protein GCM10010384_35020 [Streptomyces djakartensis]